MTLEECKQIHEIIWRYVSNKFIDGASVNRIRIIGKLKEDICNEKEFRLKFNCALCEYAFMKSHNKNRIDGINFCEYCPALWGTENNSCSFYCEKAKMEQLEKSKEDGTYLRNWFLSNPEEVKNIKWKDEVE